MAEGFHRATGQMAAVVVTSGPGTTNLATPVALALREQTPLLVLSAQVSTSTFGRGAAQELETTELFRSITKAAVTLSNPDRIADTICELVQTAQTAPRGPVFLSIPTDLFRKHVGAKGIEALERASVRPLPRYADSEQVSALEAGLDAACRPACIVGKGAVQSGASEELVALANARPELVFVTTPRAKGAFPESHPQSRGSIGFAGHPSADAAVFDRADYLLALGTRFGEISTGGWDERFARKRIAQVDVNPAEIGRIFACADPVVGDVRTVLRQLLSRGPARPLAVPLSEGRCEAIELIPSPTDDRSPIAPARLMAAVQQAFPQNGHLFVDIGNSMAWALHYLVRTRPDRWHVNLTFGSMGHALPAALGAKLGSREPVMALVGDAALLMTGTELHTAAQERLPVVTVIANDRGHGMVELGRKLLFPESQIPPMLFDPPPNIAEFARAMRVRAWTVTDPRELDEVLREAVRANEPSLVDVHIDPGFAPPIGSRTKTLMSQYSGTPESSAKTDSSASRRRR